MFWTARRETLHTFYHLLAYVLPDIFFLLLVTIFNTANNFFSHV